MRLRFSHLLDDMSEFFAARKGFLPLAGLLLVLINGVLQFIPGTGWLASTNLLLHLGIVLAILGFLMAWAL